MKKTFKVSVILRSEINSLEDIQKWLSKYNNNLKVTVKEGYLAFYGNPDFQVVPSEVGLTLYWTGWNYEEFMFKRNKFFNTTHHIPLALKLGAQIMQQGNYWLSLLTANKRISDEAALLAIHLHYIKERMHALVDELNSLVISLEFSLK